MIQIQLNKLIKIASTQLLKEKYERRIGLGNRQCQGIFMQIITIWTHTVLRQWAIGAGSELGLDSIQAPTLPALDDEDGMNIGSRI